MLMQRKYVTKYRTKVWKRAHRGRLDENVAKSQKLFAFVPISLGTTLRHESAILKKSTNPHLCGTRAQTDHGEGLLPAAYAEVHHHHPEVALEATGQEVPPSRGV